MSGYNAEISQPAEKDDEPTSATLHNPAEFTPRVMPYASHELPQYSGFEDVRLGAVATNNLDPDRLLATIREMQLEARKPIQADDYRLQHIWEQAGEIANDKGYCNVFDEFMSDLGTGYERTREYCLTVQVTRTYDVHVTAGRDANMYDLNEALDGWSVEDIESNENTDNGDWEITNWEYAD